MPSANVVLIFTFLATCWSFTAAVRWIFFKPPFLITWYLGPLSDGHIFVPCLFSFIQEGKETLFTSFTHLNSMFLLLTYARKRPQKQRTVSIALLFFSFADSHIKREQNREWSCNLLAPFSAINDIKRLFGYYIWV